MEHSNKSIIKVLREEFADYDYNTYHYDRQYKMIEKAMEIAIETDEQITDRAIKYAKQFAIRDKPIHNEKVQGYAVRDFFAGYKAALAS